MAFKKGDRVKFLNDVGGGQVVGFQGNEMAVVLTDDGWEMPVIFSELLLMESPPPVSKPNAPASVVTTDLAVEMDKPLQNFDKKGPAPKQEPQVNIHCAFVPTDAQRPTDSDLDFHLVNDSDWQCFFVVSQSQESKQTPLYAGKLEANSKLLLSTIKRSKINDLGEMLFQFLFYSDHDFVFQDPVVSTLRVNPVRFFDKKNYVANDFFHQKALLKQVAAEDWRKQLAKSQPSEQELLALKLAAEKSTTKPSKPHRRGEELRVDLHLEELVEAEHDLADHEKLKTQMDHFHKGMSQAITEGYDRAVFIHGVGTGRLRTEIRAELGRTYKQYRYQDASFKEYGYGATMVYIKP